jgi:pimeloyl-ACP methyl ester carboxylesterase
LLDTTFVAEAPDVAMRRAAELDSVSRSGTAGLRRLIRDCYLPRYFAECNRDQPSLDQLLVQMASACGPAVFARQWHALAGRPDSRATIATIDCPALVVCGAEDQLCPPAMHREMAAMIGIKCHVLACCGHLSSLEAPKPISDLMSEWLQSVEEREWGEAMRDVAS